ncbi:hypothetical protein VC83_05411 [Pseudogymnoascus destructans]|uniref:Uncharacterized protein n=1 Tax=Pseudogymnoascus destructans TaxID=655981 RepID=A0A177AA93_9PEZI|nr:uncharacterized protein VC83_05411 [Pseudogymnoascus destructans]OAF58024.1 hypothetical protein VC83_05411 [Pseudogymnoascus destructans]
MTTSHPYITSHIPTKASKCLPASPHTLRNRSTLTSSPSLSHQPPASRLSLPETPVWRLRANRHREGNMYGDYWDADCVCRSSGWAVRFRGSGCAEGGWRPMAEEG